VRLRPGAPAALALAIALGAPHAQAQWQPPAAAPQPQVAPPASPFAGLLGGGLTLPPPTPPSPESIRTAEELDQAKRDDAGRRLEWVWIDVDGGFEQLGMQTFSGGGPQHDGLVAGFVPTSSSGGMVSAAAGARLLFFTLLVRGRIGFFDSGQLYRVGPEVGFHVPLGRVEPHVALGLGYAAMGNVRDVVGGVAAADISLRGFYARVSAGLDYYVAPIFSIGLDLSADLLGLTRPALSAAEVQLIQTSGGVGAGLKQSAALLGQSGSAWGGTLAAAARLGLHF
jgi:hypothetical protein